MPLRSLGATAAGCTVKCRLLFLLPALLLLTAPDVCGQAGVATEGNGAVRTVMDLMEVMLNRDILDMLQNGGFDFREPARIFLPPKFYSIVPHDPGQMSADQILAGYEPQRDSLSPVAIGGKATQQKPSGAVADKLTRAGGELGGSRINLISYSDGKVTTADGRGRRPAVTNKGSETLEKNVGTNVNVGALGRTNFQERINGKQTRPANDRQQQQQQQQSSLTTSITDQTVSQNVGRTLPTSGRVGGGGGRGSTKDQLRSALPGEPDVDYPILGSVPATQFSCDGRHHGYYADVETRCQVFRVCANTDSTGRGFAFLCPNGTLFNQRHLVCDWYMNVRCEESENLYSVNEAIGETGMSGGRLVMSGNRQEMMDVVMSMVTYPMRSLMDMMNGVGVIEQRFEQADGQGQEIEVPPSSRRSEEYITPGTGLDPPYNQERTQYTGSLNVDIPVVNSYSAGLSSPVNVPNNRDGSDAYRPKLDNVYVSSLGTLSTDHDSGFDPQRSTLLTRTEGSVRTVSRDPQADSYGIVNENQYGFSSPLAADIQLVRADLIKSWNDQPRALPQQTTPSLKVAFVPRISQQSSVVPPSPQHQYQPHHQTTGTIFRQGSILPPTGVLPPSTLTRTVVIGGSKTYSDPSVHRFAPVHRVVPIQRVTVVPENSYQQQSRTRPTNFYYPAGGSIPSHRTNPLVPVPRTVVHPAAAAAPVASNLPFTTLRLQQNRPTEGLPVSHRQTVQQVPVAASNRDISYAPPLQLLRRSDDALPEALTSTSAVPRKLKTTTVLQVVPALSFYLNDVQEKRAFDEAVRKGLFDERRRNGQVYTSYDVPLGSVGHLGAAY